MIGIGITTHNRPDVFQKTYKNILDLSPDGARVVVVDDGSTVPVENADFRFDTPKGIATAKNKCLELLEDCDHIFLFDDDCYPTKKDWHVPFVEGVEPHAMHLFQNYADGTPVGDCKIQYDNGTEIAHSHPRGCMLYVRKEALEKAGGMDTSYSRWGYEHVDWSNRIYNLGLTSFRYPGIKNSSDFIYSSDEHKSVESTVPGNERSQYMQANRQRFNSSFTSKEYMPYKTTEQPTEKQDISYVTTLFGSVEDFQRKTKWNLDYSMVKKLAESLGDRTLHLISDNPGIFDQENILPEYSECLVSPYFQRWLALYKFLRKNKEIEYVFCVDATDVELVNEPSGLRKGMLYIGDEPKLLGIPWMRAHSGDVDIRNFILRNGNLPLLNCGVVGGDRETVMEFCRDMWDWHVNHSKEGNEVDMPAFNYLMRTKWNGRWESGRHITSVFMDYEKETSAWWRHK